MYNVYVFVMKIINFFKSYFIKLILLLINIKIGKNFYCTSFPNLKLNGFPQNIIIGNNVSFLGKVDLRNRESGKIIIENNVKIEGNSRIVSAKDGIIKIGESSTITTGAIINGGGNVIIGKNCIIGPNNIINANDHKISLSDKIIDREFEYGDVIIEEDCWTGAFVSIKKNVKIQKGSIIGAHSFITKDTLPNSINYGVPGKHIKNRT